MIKIFEAKENELPEILHKFVDVSLPKSDLNNWIGILNKFDRLLENIISKYELATIQKVDFEPQDKELILAILALTKSLFDKCTNRNLYCSYEVTQRPSQPMNSFSRDSMICSTPTTWIFWRWCSTSSCGPPSG